MRLVSTIVVGWLALAAGHGQAVAQYAIVAIDDARGDTAAIIRDAAEGVLQTRFQVVPSTGSDGKRFLSQFDACKRKGGSQGSQAAHVSIDDACVQTALTAVSLDQVLYLRVDHAQGEAAVTLSAVVFSVDGGRVREKRAGCKQKTCYDKKQLTDLAIEVSAAIMGIETTTPEQPATLEVTTVPPGAEIFLGDRSLGPSGQRHTIPAGKHRLRVVKPGYLPVPVDIDVAPGDNEILQVELRRDGDGDGAPGRSRFGAWKWVSLAGGASLAALGVVGVVIDGPRFAGQGPEQERQEDSFRTLPHGIAGLTAGAVLMGISVYMFFNDEPDDGGTTTAVFVVDGGLGFTLGGVF